MYLMRHHIALLAAVAAVSVAAASLAGEETERPPKAPAKNSKAWKAMKKGYDEAIRPIFEAKCFDCHSANTHYPWYYKMPLAKGLVDADVRKARRVLDFTDGFPFTGVGDLSDHLHGLREVAMDGSMPPFRYWIMHWSSKLTKQEKETIVAWTEGKPLPGAESMGAKPAPKN